MKVREQSERELLVEFSRGGCGDAFGELVARHAGMVRAVAMRKLGVPTEAEEVAQVVFTVLARKAAGLAEVGSLGAWLHRVTVLECRKTLRAKQREKRGLHMIREHWVTEESEGWNEVRAEVDDAFDRLSRDEREVLILHYIEGRTFREVALPLETTAEAARKRCARALEKLTSMLRKKGVAIPAVALGAWLGSNFATPLGAGMVPTSALAKAALAKAGAAEFGSLTILLTTMKTITTGCFAVGLLLPFCWERLAGAGSRVNQTEAQGRADLRIGRESHAARRPDAGRFDFAKVKLAFTALDRSERAERWREMELRKLMFALQREELDQVLELFATVENKSRFSEVVCAFFARYAELDGPESVRLALETGDFRQAALRGAFMTWAAVDEPSALAWMAGSKVDGGYDLTRRWLTWKVGVDAEGAGVSAQAVVAIFPEKKAELYRDLVREWVKSDHAGAAKWSAAEGDGRLRDELLEEVVRRHGELGGSETLDYAAMISDPTQREKVLNETLRWTGVRGGYRMLRHLKEYGFRDGWSDENVRRFSAGMMVNRPDQLPVLLEIAASEDKRQRVYEGVLDGAMWTEPPLVADAAAGVGDAYLDSERGTKAFGDFAARWVLRDREGARAWMDGLAPGTKKDLAERAWNKMAGLPATSGEEGR